MNKEVFDRSTIDILGCPMQCGMSGNIPGLYLLDTGIDPPPPLPVVTAKNVSSHYHISPKG